MSSADVAIREVQVLAMRLLPS